MFEEALRCVEATQPWHKRMDTLSLVLKTHLVDLHVSRSAVDVSLLEQAIAIAREGVARLLAETSTIGVAAIQRASYGEVIDTLVTIVFTAVAQPPPSLAEMEVVLDARSPAAWGLVKRLSELMQLGSQWMLRLVAGRKLAVRYAALPPAERSDWECRRTAFAEQMAKSHFDLSFLKKLQDRQSDLWQHLDRVRYFGTLAQLDRAGTQQVGERLSEPPNADAALLFHTLVTRAATSPVFGFLVVTAECTVVWTSRAWSAWAEAYSRGNAQDRTQLLKTMPPCSLAQVIAALGISTICTNDLTRGNIPLELAIDPASNCLVCTNPTTGERGGVVRLPRQMQFWGGFEFNRQPSYLVADEERELLLPLPQGRELRLAFPALPSKPTPLKGVPKPLPMAHYERWELLDVTADAGVAMQSSWGRAERSMFLRQDWSTCDILHWATHGEAVAEMPECSHLVLGNATGLPDCLTFPDILSLDWSRLSLVFLNCCVTEVGRQTYGDDRLSLAWAFLAGGARAVIAHRWRVSDAAAYLFAKQFYRAWLLDGSTIRTAFWRARQALRQTPSCSAPSVWGTFVLLENPWN